MTRAPDYARISVTERCDFRCLYCIGSATGAGAPQDTRDLPFEHFAGFARAALACGIAKFRLTGGEPLLHERIADMVALLAECVEPRLLGLTTNGSRLAGLAGDLHRAGLRTVNISLPSLRRETFRRVTGRDELDNVLAALEKVLSLGFEPVKINVVVLRGVNDDEICALASLARERPVEVRFIEYMPFAGHGLSSMYDAACTYVPAEEVIAKVRLHADLGPLETGPPACAARVHGVRGWKGRVGFIAPVSRPFCEGCGRVRLTARGTLRACLVEGGDFDLSDELRQGLRPARLRAMLKDVMAAKPDRHHGSFKGSMICIGG